MKRRLILLLMLLCATTVTAQRGFFFNIRGQGFPIPDGETVVVYYSPAYCHQCMADLSRLCSKWVNAEEGRHFYVMVKGEDIAVMRSCASHAKEFFEKGHEAEVVFDLNPIKKDRFSERYKIKECPVLIHIDKEGKETFYPYSSMFGSSKRLRKLPKTIDN